MQVEQYLREGTETLKLELHTASRWEHQVENGGEGAETGQNGDDDGLVFQVVSNNSDLMPCFADFVLTKIRHRRQNQACYPRTDLGTQPLHSLSSSEPGVF